MVLELTECALLRTFIRVLSDCCLTLHLGSYKYYFVIASRNGAEGRVMGIASAVETAPSLERFFSICTERFIPSVFRGSSPLLLDQVSCSSAPATLAMASPAFDG